jgi:iron complex outermembrane receptor protein
MIKANLQYRQDVHREHNVGQPVRTMSDGTTTAAVENDFRITKDLKLLTGFSFANRVSIEAQNYNSNTGAITDFPHNNNNAWDLQGGLEYKVGTDGVLSFSVARKTRFATIKDRYSYSLGAGIPNPYLTPEYSVNYDLGYKSTLTRWLTLESALFYSHIEHTILSVNNVEYDSSTRVWESQVQNVGRSEYVGGELGLEAPLSPSVKLGANYTYIKRNDLSNPSILFTDVPRSKLFGYAQYSYRDLFYIQVNGEYDSKRNSTSYGAVADAFSLFNAVASYHVWKYFSLEGGVNNILDRNYSLVEGYPEPGRNYFVNLRYRY